MGDGRQAGLRPRESAPSLARRARKAKWEIGGEASSRVHRQAGALHTLTPPGS